MELTDAELAVIMLTDDIETHTIDGLLDAVSECVNHKVKEVRLLLSSRGGDVQQAIAAYNILRGLPIKISTHNVGTVASSANIIYLAGSKRLTCPNATFMIHGLSLTVPGPDSLDITAMKTLASHVAQDDRQFRGIMAEACGLEPKQVKRYFKSTPTFLNARQGLTLGLATAIEKVSIPPHAQVIGISPKAYASGC